MATLKAVESYTLTNTSPGEVFPVPGVQSFGGNDWQKAKDLEEIGRAIIDAHDAVSSLKRVRVKYMWRRQHASKRGGITKAAGLLQHFANADFVVWLSAEHVRDNEFTNLQVEAALYHELRHADSDDEGKPSKRKPDLTAFRDELAAYGAWEKDLEGGRQGLLDFESREDAAAG